MSEDQKDQGTQTFSEEYVRELRAENAQWRTKYRELEAQQTKFQVKEELLSQGASTKVNPKWVEQSEGETISDAVSRFLVDYPEWKSSVEGPPVDDGRKNLPKPKPGTPRKNSNTPGPNPSLSGNRELKELREDPKARSQLRSQYRELVAQASNRKTYGE